MPWIILRLWRFLCPRDTGRRGKKFTACAQKGNQFQAVGLLEGMGFTSWSIWKGRETCHFGLLKDLTGLTGTIYGCQSDKKTFPVSNLFIFKRRCIYSGLKGCSVLNWYLKGVPFVNKRSSEGVPFFPLNKRVRTCFGINSLLLFQFALCGK